MEIVELDRESYLLSIKKISNYESLKFAKKAMDWWDDFFSWKAFPPLCLKDENDVVCYLFYHISKDKKYLTIHNILTPKNERGKGYGYALLDALFERLKDEKIQRFKLSCVSSSLGFYNKLGLNYWGVTKAGQYYCDFKMPIHSIKEIPCIVEESDINDFSESELSSLYEKLKENGESFDEKESGVFQKSLETMGKRYIFSILEDKINSKS